MSMTPPTRPTTGPGIAPATVTPSRSSGGIARPKPAAAPAAQTPRKAMTTSTVIAWWRVVVVISCLAAAVIAPLVLNDNRESLQRVNAATQQVILLQSVRGEVLAAEASATQGMLIAAPGAIPNDDYVDRLASAAQKLASAATLNSSGRGALPQINAALTSYTSALSGAMSTASAPQMAAASTELQGVLLPLLDGQIQLNKAELNYSATDQRWLSALVAVPILLTLIASVVVARRTRRVLNIGLLIGLALLIGMWVLITQLVTTSAQSVSAVQSSGVAQATAAAQAYSAVTEAKAVEGRVLLGVAEIPQGTFSYKYAMDDAAEMLAKLPNADTDGMVAELERMIATHDVLMAAAPEDRARLVADAQEPYDNLVAWLADQSDQIGSALDRQLTAHATTVSNAVGLVAAGVAMAAVVGAIGLSQPLRRYR